MNKNNLAPKARSKNVVVQEMEHEILIYDLKINKAFCLNRTSALVYQYCDGQTSIAEISRILSQKLNQPMTEDLIWLALDGFKKDNLLEESEKFEINFNGLSRRQVIKKVGLASMVLLPLVSSLVAPTGAAAASVSCLIAVIGVCKQRGTEACPPTCSPGTAIKGTLYASTNGTCSGGAVGSFQGGCPSGFIGFDYTVD